MRQLLGWYATSFAAEPFLVSAVATYIPLFLEQLARNNAVWAIDHRTPCLSVPVDDPSLGPVPMPPPACVVRVLYWYIDTSSLPLYTFSVSVLVQTILVISITGIADRGAHRKRLLVLFAVIGACSVIIMGFISTKHYYIAALLAIVGNAAFGAVSVCANAYLPSLVDEYVYEESRRRQAAFDRYYGACAQLEEPSQTQISAKISGRGVAIGYFAALFMQMFTMFLVLRFRGPEGSTRIIQLVIALIGLWWLVFQIPVVRYLKSNHSTSCDPNSLSFWENLGYGWKSLAHTIAKAQELQDVCIFLVGWFVTSDAITTINSTAILFARANLQMNTPALAAIGLCTIISGIFGSLVIGRMKFKNPADSIILITLIAAVIPLYGVLGFFTPWFGLRRPFEMYLMAAWYGLALGGLNAVCRSVFSLMIPRGHETMFFALFSVTDKGSSILGPAITGLITDKTHNIRYTFYFLLFMLLLAALVFSKLNVERGIRESRVLEEEPDSI